MEKGKPKVSCNLFVLRRKLEIHNKRKYTWVEIAEKSGLSRKTVERMAQNQYRQVRFSSLEALLGFFAEEGMPIGIEELLSVSYEAEGDEPSPN